MTADAARSENRDLATDAAQGDVGAYTTLYYRHIVAAWRLAQATAPSTDAAAKATTNAFVRVVRLVGRGRDDVGEQFRFHLLAAVYRDAHSRSDQVRPVPRQGPATDADARLVAAFANLPGRWRAALWLQEVDGLAPAAAGPVLGVSSAAALQLKKQALAGLEHRVVQAGGSLPLPDVSLTLAATAGPLPRVVQAKSEAKWKKAVAGNRRYNRPAAVWTRERLPRPLLACAAGLCVVGLVGLAVVNPKTIDHVALARPPASATSPSGTAGVAPVVPNPAAGAAPTSAATTTTTLLPVSQEPDLIATPPATISPVTTVATTLPPVVPVTVTVPTTLPPVTITTAPPVTTPPVTTPPASAPLLQVSLNTPALGVNVGLGPNACTGVNLLGIKVGCTKAPSGLTLGGTLLGEGVLSG